MIARRVMGRRLDLSFLSWRLQALDERKYCKVRASLKVQGLLSWMMIRAYRWEDRVISKIWQSWLDMAETHKWQAIVRGRVV